MVKQGFIGFGNLAKALYRGLSDEKDMEFAYIDLFKKEVNIPYCASLEDLVDFADFIWLTVKPQELPAILQDLKRFNLKDKTIISPVAGKSIAYIEQFLSSEQLIIRIMPNLALAYKASVTAFNTNRPNSEKAKEALNLLEKLGQVIYLEENRFDLFTAIFGSGPAFILTFIKTFKSKIEKLDLPHHLVEQLLFQLAEGTAQYWINNHKDLTIEDLIANITSRGGTTEAGLNYFHDREIAKQIEGMVEAAQKKSQELSRDAS